MEAIAAYSRRSDLPRQRKRACHCRHRVMERGVETGNLHQTGTPCGNDLHWFQIMRHVQRIERDQSVECGQQRRCNPRGGNMFRTSMHDTMSDRGQAAAVEMRIGEHQ